MRRTSRLPLLILAVTTLACSASPASPASPARPQSPAGDGAESMRSLVEAHRTDAQGVRSFWSIDPSPNRLLRLAQLEEEWVERVQAVDFDALDQAGRIDYLLLLNHLQRTTRRRERYENRLDELGACFPFAATIIRLEERRWRVEAVSPEEAARTLKDLADEIRAVRDRIRAEEPEPGEDREEADEAEDHEAEDDPDAQANALELGAVDALWVTGVLDELESALESWYDHYADYVPAFAWWCAKPKEKVTEELEGYAEFLREELAGQKGEDDDPLVGDPIGREALLEELAFEMLPYSPEELIAIGELEFAWCEEQMVRAANDLGYVDWKEALAYVKTKHVPPGRQDDLVARQAREAIAFLEERDLVTIPELCKETWRVTMLSRQSQRFLPFAAYGGQEVLVAYPTADMKQEAKEMSMRGNNIHFTRCVTPHELVPGHHLQGFMAQRYNTHRRMFSTPFYGEGWALYWEMVEWDRGWARSPEDRIGMLFWRMHRAARIIVSLGFHLDQMTPQEMIDFLVERVGHEVDGATSEVRRYIGGNYGPLYQCGYMIGGIQLRALAEELVDSGMMSPREFHDAVLQQNSIPIEMVRASLSDVTLTRHSRSRWRFAGDPETK